MNHKAKKKPSNDLTVQDSELSSDQKGFIERMEQCATIVGSVNALAKKAGLSQSGIRRYFSGGDPTRSALVAIAKAAGVSPEWLATGEGSMRPGQASGGEEEDFEEEFALVPLYDVEVSAGHGAHVDQEPVKAQIAFRRDWLAQNHFNVNNLVSLTARGDSMEPTIRDGDLLLVDTSQKDVIEDGIYILRMNKHLLAKRLQRLFDGTIVVKSDNPAYERQEIPPAAVDQLELIGRVVWTGRKT